MKHQKRAGERSLALLALLACLSMPMSPVSAKTDAKPDAKTAAPSADKSATTTPAGDSKGPTVNTWVFNMSSNFAGTGIWYFNSKAVRVKFDKLGLLVLTKAPKWDAIIYNDSNNNYVSLPYEQWKQRFALGRYKKSNAATQPKVISEKTGKSEMIQGYKAIQILLKREDKLTKKVAVEGEVWVAPAIVAPPQFNKLMHNLLDVPSETVGTPLRALRKNNQTGKMVSIMDCFKVAKEDVPLSYFEEKKGYRKVKDEMALMLDEGDESALDSLGSTSPAGKPTGDDNKLKELLKKK